MNIGVEQDNGTRVWGTITGIVGLVVTGTFVTTTTSKVLNTVVAYTSEINRPLEILRATSCDLKNNDNEVTLEDISYDEYFNYPIKNLPGQRPNNFYYDRVLGGSLPYQGTLYLFPTPSQSSITLNFTYTDSLQQMLNSGDTQDLPQEWTLPLLTNLAALLAQLGYGKMVELQPLQALAKEHYMLIKNFDSDDEALSILPYNSFRPGNIF
jgi:hypothetical protein